MSDYREMWSRLSLDVELHQQLLDSMGRKFGEQVLRQQNRPQRLRYFDDVIRGAHTARVQELIDHRNAGGKVIGTFCIYVPDEIALALGVTPVALCGGTPFSIPYAERTLPRDICPLIKSTLGLAFSKTCPYAPVKDMAVGETTCDAKKKTWDFLGKVANFHVMEVPQKKQATDAALWQAEVVAFAQRLEQLTSRALEAEELSKAIRLVNRKRKALARLYSYRKSEQPPISGTDALVVMQAALNDDAARFCGKLEGLNEELEERLTRGISVADGRSRRVMIAGCPSVMGNWKMHHLIETSGAVVVCDETCTGTRYFEDLVAEQDGSVEQQLRAIAERYMKIDCACFSPNEERIENILRLAKEYRVHGVVQYVLQYCHGYNVEALNVARALKEEGIPGLKIETDYSEEDTGQLRTRIEAFLERT